MTSSLTGRELVALKSTQKLQPGTAQVRGERWPPAPRRLHPSILHGTAPLLPVYELLPLKSDFLENQMSLLFFLSHPFHLPTSSACVYFLVVFWAQRLRFSCPSRPLCFPP